MSLKVLESRERLDISIESKVISALPACNDRFFFFLRGGGRGGGGGRRKELFP